MRLQALQTLLTYVEEATRELIWLNDKEDTEITRDWSSRDLHVQQLEHYHQVSSQYAVIHGHSNVALVVTSISL